MLTAQTRANYRVQLRRLWEINKLMDDDDERKPALLAQISRLCDKLGYEIDRLDIALYQTTKGRPKVNPDVSDLETQRMKMKEDPNYWLPEAIDARNKKRIVDSAKALDEMQALVPDQANALKEVDERLRLEELANEALATGGDKHEGHGETTDHAGEAAGDK